MARDYAAQSRASNNKRRKPTASRRAAPAAVSPWRWYFAGVISGLVLGLAMYLVTLPPGPGEIDERSAAEAAPEAPPRARFDFYTILPEQTIDVEVEPADVAQPRSTTAATSEVYLLQAGSFRQREDADRRRAELLLLGLEPRVEESSSDNGRWFRVFLGPYDTRASMSRARSLTAGQDIDTLLLKRSRNTQGAG